MHLLVFTHIPFHFSLPFFIHKNEQENEQLIPYCASSPCPFAGSCTYTYSFHTPIPSITVSIIMSLP
jgi:hypothetical protein